MPSRDGSVAPSPTESPGGAYRSPASTEELDEAVDTVAMVVRDVGRFAIDVGVPDAEPIAEEAEGWAKHLLLLVPSPEGTGQNPQRRRDWAGVRRFFARHRRAESRQVSDTLHGLRSIVWAFVRSLRNAVGDADGDAEVLRRLEHLRQVALGGDPARLADEALSVADAVSAVLARRAERERTERAQLGERLQTLGFELEAVREVAAKDGLTGVMNRGALDTFLERTTDLTAAFGQEALLLLVDVDRFKAVNDGHGHPAGDEVLRALARRLVRTFLRKNDFIARYGGEEFAVVMRDAGLAQAERIGDRLLEAVRSMEVELEGGEVLRITVSAGIAAVRPRESSAEWVARADEALYRAKREGRDRCVVAV